MIRFEDAVIEKAYHDYLYTRDMMDADRPEGTEDLSSVSMRYLKQHGKLDKLVMQDGGSDAAIRINVNAGGENEPWLLAFKNFAEAGESAGAVLERCIDDAEKGGMKSFAAIKLSGGGDPLEQTTGLDPEGGEDRERRAAGESAGSFSLQAGKEGIAVGIADEFYHPDFSGRRLEGAAVVSAMAEVDSIGSIEPDAYSGNGANDGFDVNTDNSDASVNDGGGEDISVPAAGEWNKSYINGAELSFADGMKRVAEDLNTCSRRGLSQRFDSSIGTGAVMMPHGGINQLTPVQAASYKLPADSATDDCVVASWASNPYVYKESPYHGAYLAVIESVAKLIGAGASFHEIYLSVMAGTGEDRSRALSALIGAFEAEMGLSVPAINSCECEGADGFVSYAVTVGKASELISPEFKGAGHRVVILEPYVETDENSAYYGLPTPRSLTLVWRKAYELIANGRAEAAYTPGMGGIAEAVMKMSYGNGIGFEFADSVWSDEGDEEALTNEKIFGYSYGSIILEMSSDEPIRGRAVKITDIGHTTEKHTITKGNEAVSIGELLMLYEGKLESVYPSNSDGAMPDVSDLNYAARSWHTPIFKRAEPKVLIPALPGATSCADVARAVRSAGGRPELLTLPGGSAEEILRSAEKFAEAIDGAQVIFLPDGYAGAIDNMQSDVELDLAELTTYIFRNEMVTESISRFLDKKDGLIAGIGSGFKALLDLGLLPGGVIGDEDGPMLQANALGAHQSRIVRVRVASNKSPWLRSCRAGEVYSLPLSCSEGRFTAPEELIKKLAVNGQIATQYADDKGHASSDIRFNPAGSMMAIEGITSPDGRVLGRMAHAERAASGLYRNVPGTYFTSMFENAVRYFK